MFKKTSIIIILIVSIFILGNFVTFADEFPAPRVVKDRPLEIAYCRLNLDWASGIRPYKQIKIEEKIRDWKVNYVTGISEVARQREAVESLIQRDVDAIIIDNFQILQFKDLVAKARNQGIGVYTIDTPIVPGVIAETTMPNGIFSAEMAYWGLDKLQYSGKYAQIGWEITHWGVERTFPILSIMENTLHDIEVVDYVTPDYENYVDSSYEIASGWMSRYGEELDWIHTPFDGIGMPVANAVLQAGYTSDDIMVTGIDAGIEAMELIRDKENPYAATYGQFFEAYAHYILEIIEEVQVEGIMPGDKESSVPEGKIIRFEGDLFDASNVPADGTIIYELHGYDGLDPDDPDAWVNWYKQTDIEPYKYEY